MLAPPAVEPPPPAEPVAPPPVEPAPPPPLTSFDPALARTIFPDEPAAVEVVEVVSHGGSAWCSTASSVRWHGVASVASVAAPAPEGANDCGELRIAPFSRCRAVPPDSPAQEE